MKWKGYDNSFSIELIKKASSYKMSYFPVPYSYSKNRMIVELYLSNYAAKSELKRATGADTSEFP